MPKVLQEKKGKRLQSLWPGKILRFKSSRIKSQAAPLILLRNCSTVTMGKFKACICDNNLSVLRVSGAPTPTQLLEAWQTLFLEFCDLTEDKRLKEQLLAPVKLHLDKRFLDITTAWLKIAKVLKSKEICRCLEQVFPVQFNMEDELAYRGTIAEIQAELIAMGFDIRVREAEMQAKTNIDKNKKQIDRKHFATIFFRINNYAKREAVNDQTTVEDYVVALKCYEDYLEQINNQ